MNNAHAMLLTQARSSMPEHGYLENSALGEADDRLDEVWHDMRLGEYEDFRDHIDEAVYCLESAAEDGLGDVSESVRLLKALADSVD